MRCSRWCPLALGVVLLLTGCSGNAEAGRAAEGSAPRLGAEIVQLRRDEVLKRVEIGVTNKSRQQVTIDSIELSVPGYSGGGVQRKGEPLPAGQLVNLPTPYGDVLCDDDFRPPRVGRAEVSIRVHTEADPAPRRVVLRPSDPRDLLHRIAQQTCLARRLDSEVKLSFAPHWRHEGHGADTVLHGRLRVRLLTDQPRDVTQIAGSVIFDLIPERATQPLGRVTPAHPSDAIPVFIRRSRCDGHARGETKKPYEFLVWVGAPGTDGLAMTPLVSATDQDAFDAVCPL